MEKKFRLIAFDMDGTLLDSNKTIRQDSIEAIAKAVSYEKYCVLSTGRGMCELTEYLSPLKDMQYFICESGGVIYNLKDGSYLSRKTIPHDYILEIMKRTLNHDILWHIHCDDSVIQKSHADKMSLYHMDPFIEMFKRMCVMPESLKSYIINENPSIYKFNLYCRTEKVRDAVTSLIEDIDVTYSFSEQTSIEVSPLGVSKASGLRELCNYLSVPIEQTIAVGDGDNDLQILKTAGLAVAMGNANKHVKDIAGAIVANNDSCGCAQAVYSYLLS